MVVDNVAEGSNRVRVVADVDLWVVGKTLVARSLIGDPSSALRLNTEQLRF